MDKKLAFDRMFEPAQRLLNRFQSQASVFEMRSGYDPIAERELSSDRISNVDSRLIDAYHEVLSVPGGDSYRRFKRLTKINELTMALGKSGTSLDHQALQDPSTRFGRYDSHAGLESLRDAVINKMVTALDTDSWQLTLIGNNLVHELEGTVRESMRRGPLRLAKRHAAQHTNTRLGEGSYGFDVNTSRGRAFSTAHGEAYTRVLQRASSSLDIGMYQFEHAGLLSETALAMERVSQNGGRFHMTLSRPNSHIDAANALTTRVLKRIGDSLTTVQGASIQIGYDARTKKSGGGTPGTLAHQKFIGANLHQDDLQQMAFAMGTANVTQGAIGPLAQDGMILNRFGNIEMTFYADYQTMVLDNGMRDDVFRNLMHGARAAADYATGRRSTLSSTDTNGFFMSGGETATTMQGMLNEALEIVKGGGKVHLTLLVNQLRHSAYDTHIRKNLVALATAMGETGGRIEIVAQGLNAQDFGLSKSEATGFIEGRTQNFGLLARALGLAGYSGVHFVDTHGYAQHGKGMLLTAYDRDDNRLWDQMLITSSNITQGGFVNNVELGARIHSSSYKGLGSDVDAFRQGLGTSLNYKMFYDPSDPEQAQPGTVYQTPFTVKQLHPEAAGSFENKLNIARRNLAKRGIGASIKMGYGGAAGVINVNTKVGGQMISGLMALEMHAQEDGSVWMPKFNKTIRKALQFTLADSEHEDVGFSKHETIGAERIIQSAIADTMRFLEQRVVGKELRARAYQRLSQRYGAAISEGMLDEEVKQMLSQVYTQQMMKTRAQGYLLNKLGSYEAEPVGRYAYRSKAFQMLAFTADANGFLQPAKIGFRSTNLQHEPSKSLFFQRPADGFMQRDHRINPITGEPEVQVGKVATGEAFDHLPFASRYRDTEGDNQEYLQLFVPMTKFMQLPQRLGNLFSVSIYDEYEKDPTGKMIRSSRDYILPMQPGAKEYQDNPLRFYRYRALVHYGPNTDNDVAYANARRFKDMKLGIERPVLYRFDRSVFQPGQLLSRVAELEGRELTGDTLDFGTVETTTVFGSRQQVRIQIKNPAKSLIDSGGYSVLERVGSSESLADSRRNELRLQFRTFRDMSSGLRMTLSMKQVINVLTESAFGHLLEEKGLMGRQTTLAKLIGMRSNNDVDLVTNRSGIKSGDMMLQTGAHLIREYGGEAAFRILWKQVENKEDFVKRLARKMSKYEEWRNPKQGKSVYDAIPNESETHSARLYSMVNPRGFNKIGRFEAEAIKLMKTLEKGKNLNSGTVDHTVAAGLVWMMWEQLHLDEGIKAMRGKGRLKNFASENKTTITLADVVRQQAFNQLRHDLSLTEAEFEAMKPALQMGISVPTITGSAISSNTVALSGRPEARLLEYMNIGEGSALFRSLFPAATMKQRSVMHIAALYHYGQGVFDGRPMMTVMPGAFSAATVATFTAPGAEAEMGQIAGALRQIQMHQGSVEEAIKLVQHLLPESHMKTLRDLQQATERTTAVVSDIPTGNRIMPFETVARTFKAAGIGALRIHIPEIKMEKAVGGYRAKLLGFREVYMPDMQAMAALTDVQDQETRTAANAFIDILRIFGKERDLLNLLTSDKIKGTDEYAFIHHQSSVNNLFKLSEDVLRINGFYETILSSDLVREIFGGSKGSGVTFTASTEDVVPMGFVAVGDAVFARAMDNQRAAFAERGKEAFIDRHNRAAARMGIATNGATYGESRWARFEQTRDEIMDIQEKVARIRAGGGHVHGTVATWARSRTGLMTSEAISRTLMFRDLGFGNEFNKLRRNMLRGEVLTSQIAKLHEEMVNPLKERSEWIKRLSGKHLQYVPQGSFSYQRQGNQFGGFVDPAAEPRVGALRSQLKTVVKTIKGARGELKAHVKETNAYAQEAIYNQLFDDVKNPRTQEITPGSLKGRKRRGDPSEATAAGYQRRRENERLMQENIDQLYEQKEVVNNELSAERTLNFRGKNGSLGSANRSSRASARAAYQTFRAHPTGRKIEARINQLEKRLNEVEAEHRNWNDTLMDTTTERFAAAVDAALSKYTDSYDTGFAIEVGGKELAGVDMRLLKQLRRAEAMQEFQAIMENKETSQRAKLNKLGGVLENLAYSNPELLATVGQRAGSPTGSEHDMFKIIRIQDLNAMLSNQAGQKQYTMDEILKGEGRFDLSMSRHVVMMAASAQGLTIGDFDGDMVSLRFATRYGLLRARYLGDPKGMSKQELHEMNVVKAALLDSQRGRSFVKSAARYTGNDALLSRWDDSAVEDKIGRGKLLEEAASNIAQTRKLFENLHDFTNDYKAAYDSKKDKLSGLALHEQAAKSAIEKAMNSVTSVVTLPVHISAKRFRFLQEYTGFAGTELIGRGFNASYTMLMSAAVLNNTGVFKGQNDGSWTTLLDETMRNPSENADTQMSKLQGFMKVFNQMYRDSIKPRNVQDSQFFETMEKRGWSGAYAAMKEVGGSKTIAFLSAITKGQTVVRNLFNETVFAGSLDAGVYDIDDPRYKRAADRVRHQFTQVAGMEMAMFAYNEHFDKGRAMGGTMLAQLNKRMEAVLPELQRLGFMEDGQGIRTDFDGTHHLSGESALNRLKSLITATDTAADWYVQINDEGKAVKVQQGKTNHSDSFVRLGEYLLGAHYKDELGYMFSSSENADAYLQAKAAGKADQWNWDYKGLEKIMEIGREREGFKAAAFDPFATHKDMGISGQGKSYSLQARVGALMDILARPSSEANSGAAMKMLRQITDSHFHREDMASLSAEEREAWYKERAKTISDMNPFTGTLGETLARFHQKKDDAVQAEMEMRAAQAQVQNVIDEKDPFRMNDMLREGRIGEAAELVKQQADRGFTVGKDSPSTPLVMRKLDQFTQAVLNENTRSGRHAKMTLHSFGGAVVGVGVMAALARENQEQDPETKVQEVAQMAMLSNPQAMAYANAMAGGQRVTLKELGTNLGSLAVGAATGAVAQNLVERVAPKRLRGGLGLLANVAASTAAMFMSHAFLQDVDQSHQTTTPKDQLTRGGNLFQAASNTVVSMLMETVRGAADNLIDVGAIEDEDGNTVEVDSEDGSASFTSAADEETGIPSLMEVKENVDQSPVMFA